MNGFNLEILCIFTCRLLIGTTITAGTTLVLLPLNHFIKLLSNNLTMVLVSLMQRRYERFSLDAEVYIIV